MRLEKGRISALVDPIQALLQVGLPDGPQLQPRPRKMWHRGASTCSMDGIYKHGRSTLGIMIGQILILQFGAKP